MRCLYLIREVYLELSESVLGATLTILTPQMHMQIRSLPSFLCAVFVIVPPALRLLVALVALSTAFLLAQSFVEALHGYSVRLNRRNIYHARVFHRQALLCASCVLMRHVARSRPFSTQSPRRAQRSPKHIL